DFPQTFKSNSKETGIFRLMPKMLALMAVQRQTAASRSARPEIRVQQGVEAEDPTTMFTKPNKFAHTPSFSVSIGQVGLDGDGGGGDAYAFGGGGDLDAFGGGGDLCAFGEGGGGQGTLSVELTKVKNRRLRIRSRAVVEAALETIFGMHTVAK
ncbi:hypothetical protein CFOL_v3_15279, partial [Cephalotus follicularis]